MAVRATFALMQGLMQDVPLAIPHIFERAEKYHPHKEIVTATGAGLERTTYGEWAARTRKLGGVLDNLGISADGRVGTFAWNTARHLELYFAAPCTGRVLHTLNIRLFPEQLTYIVEAALKFFLGEDGAETLTVSAGEVLHIPSMVWHRAEALEDTLDVDIFSPPRQDWLNHTDSYFHAEKK